MTRYIKQDPITHILTRPDMYVGSKSVEQREEYVWRASGNNQYDLAMRKEHVSVKFGRIIREEVSVSPALLRTFIEILSNAIDNKTRDSSMSFIEVTLTPTECTIKNDGAVIPIEKNEGEGIYNHTLIFGHLLSGSNYDDKEQRYTSGRNGLGAKLTNVLSKSFTVEGVDPERHLKLVQTWTNNMRSTDGPKVTKSTLRRGYTLIRWEWDLKWFGMASIPQDLFAWHVLNTAMVTDLRVTLNKVRMPNKVTDYFQFLDGDESKSLKLGDEKSTVVVTKSHGEFEAISFVNGIFTKNGGRHVTAWVEAVCRPIIEKVNNKTTSITIRDIKQHLRFLVVTNVPNPEFDGQEKNELKAPSITAKHIDSSQVTKILNWGIKDALTGALLVKDNKQLAKAISTSTPIIDGYSKANKAGGSMSKDCVLIICEGLSAKTFAMEGVKHGINGKKGRDWFGVYPLRGKLLNTRNATIKSIAKNQVITNLIKILGLDCSNPNNMSHLNYGQVCILTDADVDGIHIEGLLLNFFHSMFPQLLNGQFVVSMKTPILRVTHGSLTKYFFDDRTYRRETSKGTVKYFKGLGTNKKEDIEQVFGIKMLQFVKDDKTDASFETAFAKSESSERRRWLELYSPLSDTNGRTLDDETDQTVPFPISRHLNDELIKFFHDDCKRSIPSVFDGLKESQRKIVFAAKKRNMTTDIKVAQFGAFVAEHTNYHHGEDNLFRTIIKMAQSFIGSNNLPLFSDEGQFGSRLSGGDDASAPRYIFTKVRPYFQALFHPDDDALLRQREDDGDLVEPFFYVPTIPLLLVNGCVGIGTGWMCNMPQFNPRDVIKASHLWMDDKREELASFLQEMTPWYRHFTGSIKHSDSSRTKFQTNGTFTFHNDQVKVTELPVGLWTEKFEEELKTMEAKKYIKKLESHSTTTTINTTFKMTDTFDHSVFAKKMTTSLNLDNIVVFNKDEKLMRVTLGDILDMWGTERLHLNQVRKDAKLKDLTDRIQHATDKITFITLVKNKTIDVTGPEENMVRHLHSLRPKHKKEDPFTPKMDDTTIKLLLDMPVRTLTSEKMEALEQLRDKLHQEHTILAQKTTRDIWFEDQAQLVVLLDEHDKNEASRITGDKTLKRTTRKKAQ